jgi:hypothetical protein
MTARQHARVFAQPRPIPEVASGQPFAAQHTHTRVESRYAARMLTDTCQLLVEGVGACAVSTRQTAHLAASAPAFATCPSWFEVAPDTPIEPTIFPSTIMGRPPSNGAAPRRASVRGPIPPLRHEVFKHFAGPPIVECGACFVLGHGDRSVLGVVEPVQHDEVPRAVEDDDGHRPIVLGRLRFRGRHYLLCR